MAYQPLAADFSTMNDSQKNSAAIAAGYTGLNDYNDQVNRGLSGPTGTARPAVGAIGQAPTFDLVGATESAYNTPEIQAANKAIDDSNAKITARQQALADAQAGINDNPFYSEATRVGKSQQITQQANNDMTVIQNEQKINQGKLDSLKADAAIKLNAAKGQYDISEQAYKDNLSQFNTMLSNGAFDGASGSDIAQLAVQTGIPTSMIQSMVSASQKKNNPTQLVQSIDDQGNLTLLAVDSTGKVQNQTVIPGVAKQTKVAAGSSVKAGSAESVSQGIAAMTPAITKVLNSYGNIGPQDWQKALAAWLGQGLSKDDFIKNFGQYADTNRGDFLAAYGFANPRK